MVGLSKESAYNSYLYSSVATYGFLVILFVGFVFNARVIKNACSLHQEYGSNQSVILVGHLAFVKIVGFLTLLYVHFSEKANFFVWKDHPVLKKFVGYLWNTAIGVFAINLFLIQHWCVTTIRGEVRVLRLDNALPVSWLVSLFVAIPPWAFPEGHDIFKVLWSVRFYEGFRFALYFALVCGYFGYALYKIQERITQLDVMRRVSGSAFNLNYFNDTMTGWPSEQLRQLRFHTIFLASVWLPTGMLFQLHWMWSQGQYETLAFRHFFVLETPNMWDWACLATFCVSWLYIVTSAANYLCIFEGTSLWKLSLPWVLVANCWRRNMERRNIAEQEMEMVEIPERQNIDVGSCMCHEHREHFTTEA